MLIEKKEKLAIVFKDKEYTYSDLLKYSTAYERFFSKDGKNPEKILIFADNSPEYFFATYGAIRCGAVVVPVDVTSTLKELAFIINDCRPEILFISSSKKELVAEAVASVSNFECKVFIDSDIDVQNVDSIEVTPIPEAPDDNLLCIIYTSGTTGSPKGVMLSYKNILFNAEAVSKLVPIYREDVNVMVLLPLHHSFPFVGTMIAPMYVGGTVFIADGLTAESIISTLNKGKIGLIIGVPKLYETLAKGIMVKINSSAVGKLMFKIAKRINSKTFSKKIFKAVHQKFGGHIEHLVCGGAALPDETGIVFKTLGFSVLTGYGMTECAPMISFTRPGKDEIGYSGELLPKLEIRFSEIGEISVKGPNVMSGYYNRPEDTAQILKDGWLHTGDIGILDKKGLKITGRIKEIIVTSNGKNINPVELEFELLEKTSVMKEVAVFLENDILQALVVPDLDVVRLKTGFSVDDLLKEEFAQYNKGAMTYKRIKKFHIASADLPRTRLGKIQRHLLKGLIPNEERIQNEEVVENLSPVYQSLKTFIESETGKRAAGDSHFEIDLAMDSLTRVALIAYIETAFELTIKENQIDEYATLNKLTSYIEENSSVVKETEISWKEILQHKLEDLKLPKSGFIHWLLDRIIRVGFHLFYRYTAKGTENIPDGPCIIIGNHRSGFDGVFITSKMKWSIAKRTFFFAKDKHFNFKLAKFLAVRSNVILMNVNTNIRESLQQMSEVLKQGKNVIIFPEGTRAKDKKLKHFRDAFAILSTELNVPVLPVLIKGSELATYKSIRIPKFLSKIELEFLPPVLPAPGETIREFRGEIETIYQQKL
ncbi:MAG: long-chain fatty acid--CoA ligase [Bacteroidetes bacterium HGW-Bacteroidetes-19]|nr:MAG: long-chain fatty acid--CoA ligase [Bacteroidetes bacterium HGW-Bacteroidetes-20]PKP28255.1 MAG: long-chain fatty acid--CoA ligase [Bacteroidetes bacterium HGW-Bacteroidetes-19]